MASAGGTDGVRVIGVVADVHESSAESAAGWQMYMPASQQGPEGANLVIRSKLPPETLAPAVMATLRSINPAQPATEFKPIQGLVDHAVSPRRFFVMLVGVFAGSWAAAGFAGNLWGDLLFGHPADAGDRDSHGARRDPGARPVGGDCQDNRDGGHWHR